MAMGHVIRVRCFLPPKFLTVTSDEIRWAKCNDSRFCRYGPGDGRVGLLGDILGSSSLSVKAKRPTAHMWEPSGALCLCLLSHGSLSNISMSFLSFFGPTQQPAFFIWNMVGKWILFGSFSSNLTNQGIRVI